MMLNDDDRKSHSKSPQKKNLHQCNVHTTARLKDNEKLTDAFTALDQLTFRFKGPNSFIMFIQ